MFIWAMAAEAAKPQSLAEVARKEAERRKQLEQQGVEEKVIAGDAGKLAPKGNLSVSSPGAGSRAQPPAAKSRVSLLKYRSALQKLDRELRQCEDRLGILRQRAEDERRPPSRVGSSGRNTSLTSSQKRLYWQIQELEAKLKRLRQQRLDAYEAGRKAGFLPGELEGKGISP